MGIELTWQGAQFALMAGSNVIVASSSDEKLARVKTFLEQLLPPNASKQSIQLINYNTTPDWDKVSNMWSLPCFSWRDAICLSQTAHWLRDCDMLNVTDSSQTVLEMTSGRGVDIVIEVAGWATVGKSVKCTRKGGLVAVSGYLSTYGQVPEEIVQQGELGLARSYYPHLSAIITVQL